MFDSTYYCFNTTTLLLKQRGERAMKAKNAGNQRRKLDENEKSFHYPYSKKFKKS